MSERPDRLQKVNLADKLAQIGDHWNPRVAAELNGQQVKLVKFKGPFVWHSHATEDEMFLVVRGRFTMELRDGNIDLREGELIVIPHGVEHRPVADDEVDVLLFEPATTLNTGDALGDPRTRPVLDRI
jgi:mannose-6-phosphate isomerase-like protein (cupin superfamily)